MCTTCGYIKRTNENIEDKKLIDVILNQYYVLKMDLMRKQHVEMIWINIIMLMLNQMLLYLILYQMQQQLARYSYYYHGY